MKFLRRTWAEIDENALIHNFKIIKDISATPVMAVVKEMLTVMACKL